MNSYLEMATPLARRRALKESKAASLRMALKLSKGEGALVASRQYQEAEAKERLIDEGALVASRQYQEAQAWHIRDTATRDGKPHKLTKE